MLQQFYILFPKQNIKIDAINIRMLYLPEEIISGEKIQEIADIYIGRTNDFMWNPRIMEQPEKHQIIDDIWDDFENPPIVFVYGHLLHIFSQKIRYFRNEFVLITHNADTDLTEENRDVTDILISDKLLGWWGQNLCFVHPKMHPVPIGIANAMWEHGNIDAFVITHKTRDKNLYVNFNEYTNRPARQQCLNAVSEYGVLPMVGFKDHIVRIQEYISCACPQGNGSDTHRLWESLYTGCVPVVIKNPFINTLMHYMGDQLPIMALNSWEEYRPIIEPFEFEKVEALTVDYYKQQIYDRKIKMTAKSR
jgi:hypothetical protein